MGDHHKDLGEEEKYLEKTLAAINKQLEAAEQQIQRNRGSLTALGKDMWENISHSPRGFGSSSFADVNLYSSEVEIAAQTYKNSVKNIEKFKRMISDPYFGRFDFSEEGRGVPEKIYIGRGTLIDPDTFKVLVHDWRAPICSVYYRHELGPAEYETPGGVVTGEVLLKRQYQIKDSRLLHFFDSSVVITDEILIDILSRNASSKMRSIVESIQKEQDIIIRDTENELIVVQGAAGSGKTSIALHRIAYLLYEGLGGSLEPRNIVILSPNEVFSRYISNVLPDLGEENVEQITFDRIAQKELGEGLSVESRGEQLERIIEAGDPVLLKNIRFKGIAVFARILDRLISHYENEVLVFEDVYYHGRTLATRQELKNKFLNNVKAIPMARRLQRIEEEIWETIHPLRKLRLEKLERIVQQSEGHDLEIKAFSRLLAIKETKRLKDRLHRFTKVDYLDMYKMLFSDRKLFFQLAEGLDLPEGFEKVFHLTGDNLKKGTINYEDVAPLLYLKLKIEGANPFPLIKQVIIDEAQDYSPMQYAVFKLLFGSARYTVLGDVHQSMDNAVDLSIYDEIAEILDQHSAVRLQLTKAYRSTWEINAFNDRLLGKDEPSRSFERHGEWPRIVRAQNRRAMNEKVTGAIRDLLAEGFESVAVICKTQKEAEKVHAQLAERIPIRLIGQDEETMDKGPVVIASYMAKGLEFDGVLVYDAGKESYSSELDKRLLYMACTRALHRLLLFYTGEKSPWINTKLEVFPNKG